MNSPAIAHSARAIVRLIPWLAPRSAGCVFRLAGIVAGAGRLAAASAMPGLLGVVYKDAAMTRPAASITLARLDDRQADWPDFSDWGLRLRGCITSSVSGKAILRVETHQQARLFLNGREVLKVADGEGSVGVEFHAGTPVPLSLEYAQSARPSRLRVFWRQSGGEEEPVPASALSHDQSDLEAIAAAGIKPAQETLLVVVNPAPGTLPSLRVWRREDELLVGATFPNVPDFMCDSWCYESAMEYLASRDLGSGRLELRHRLTGSPGVLVITEVAPESGAVEFRAHLEREDGKVGSFPESLAAPNLCWQLKGAPAFASRPEPYPAFVGRCFIFASQGLTFLDHTGRRKIPVQPPDDPRNNPPWVQIYSPAWAPPRRADPGSWADYSPDRFTCSIVGAVSRDRKYLAAIVTPSADSLCQAWHDCMHISSRWEPDGTPWAQRTWRLKIYVMENDPAQLLRKAAADFPEIRRQPAFSAGAAAGDIPH